ncbi:MFS transporter [Pectinatus haikarae]|uniref:FSR family fosmidomycin resistance protein-like MFS transporter n=1 Tax=Pectinatus haikarae TaxID=349096 RepID=A0ABT9Y5W6_9FIRM|nr:MFS transporter [Pectinatus haikarae]MDQ0203212.1 FSR family fosmidomycin resistance protein-like MFS transporter [Pectinatus haikarae]
MTQKYVYALSAGHFFNDIGMGILPAVLPFFIANYGMNYKDVSGLMFAACFLSSIVQPTFGWLADRISKVWIMSLGICLSGVAMGAIGLFEDYWIIFAVVTVSGIGSAIFHPEAARMVNKISGEKKGTALSIFSMGGNAGFAFGPVIVVAFISAFGMKGTLVFSILALVMSIILLFIVPNIKKEIEATSTNFEKRNNNSTIPDRENHWSAFSRLTMLIVCSSLVICGLRSFIPLYLVAQMGLSEAAASSALTILFMFGIVTTMIGGMMADKFGYLKIVQISYALLVPMVFLLSRTENAVIGYVLMIPIGFAIFSPFSSIVVLGQNYLARSIGFASGVTLGLYFSVGGMVIPLMGMFADKYGLTANMELLTVFALLAAICSFILVKPFEEKTDKQSLTA